MKKLIALVLTLMLCFALFACKQTTETETAATDTSAETQTSDSSATEAVATAELPTINFWTTGSQNVSDVFTAVIEAWNAKEDRTCNVTLQFILSGSGDASLGSRYGAAYITGKDHSFDIIAGNGTDFLGYSDEAGSSDAFLDLDFSKMPNFQNVQMSASVFPEKLVPYRGTTVVFAYDSANLPNPPSTWDELAEWVQANPGKFTYNDPSTGGAGQAFVYNAIYRLIDDPEAFSNGADEKYIDQWDAGFEWLAMIHPYLYSSGGHIQYAVKNQGALDLLASGEVWMVPAWADGTLDALEKGTLPDTVKMYQLSDLSLSGTDVDMAICSTTENLDACYDFMNFVISVEAQQIFVEVMKAVPVIDASLLEQTDAVKAVSELNPADFNILSIGSNGGLIKDRWQEDIATLN